VDNYCDARDTQDVRVVSGGEASSVSVNQIWKNLNVSWDQWGQEGMENEQQVKEWLMRYQEYLKALSSQVANFENSTLEAVVAEQLQDLDPEANYTAQSLGQIMRNSKEMYKRFLDWFD